MPLLNKFKNAINRKFLRTPGLEFLKKNAIFKKKVKHVNFWLDRAYQNKNFRNYFYTPEKNLNLNLNLDCRFRNIDDQISKKVFDCLKCNGISIIENALPDNEKLKMIELFYELKNYKYSKIWEDIPKDKSDKSFGKSLRNCGSTNVNNFQILRKYSDQITKEIYGKSIKPTLEMHYLKLDQYEKETLSRGDTYLHTDRFLPHLKIFYTPFEITEDDAPFEYALGSHLINQDYKNFFINASNFDETEPHSKNLINKRLKVIVPQNTLYIAFTNGLHKRSVFKKRGAERYMLYLQYVKNFNKLNYLFNV